MTDPNMNVLWSMIVELSTTLSANRDVTTRLQRLAESVANTSTTIANSEVLTNGKDQFDSTDISDLPLNTPSTSDPSPLKAENERLRREIHALRSERSVAAIDTLKQEIQNLKKDQDDLNILVQQYDYTIERIMSGLRGFAAENSMTILDIHKSYAAKIKSEQDKYAALHELYTQQEQHVKTLASHLRNAYQYTATGDSAVDSPKDGQENYILKLYSLLYELHVENSGLRKSMGLIPSGRPGT